MTYNKIIGHLFNRILNLFLIFYLDTKSNKLLYLCKMKINHIFSCLNCSKNPTLSCFYLYFHTTLFTQS